VIRATIRRETPRIYLKNLPLSQALRGLLVPMGLDYKVQPDFVWISRPDVLQSETFEPLYTRAFRLQHIRADVVIPKLRAAVPDITERYTGRTLSYVESAGANGNVLAIHQTPSNLKRIEELLKVLDLPG
jgi:type II secretory pathway component HofQ